ncbi:ATP-binding protein [Pseudanabaena sp. UWO310]|uniref:ATP-binding protein n=1 Tax=Pseudanabaena sp. UWO310 TaxID=2480795 RepID=UPI001158A38E|nr:ATP-binding protein [Pseudanabaena sp. UWO310]TYQ32100.1 ATP-binding protein [Pseudanabaena sp. UWO310]
MSTASSFDELYEVINKNNPFDVPPIITGQDIWNGSFPDLMTLNAHASDAVFETVEQVRSGKPKVTSLAFSAEIGVGKSHLIRRIRRGLQADNKAFFVYANKYGDLNLIHYQFRQILADSFKQSNGHGVTQWQELAAAMVNQVVANKRPALELVNKLPQALVNNRNLIDQLTNAILKVKPKIGDPDIVRAIIWTLGSAAHAPFAIKWLAGKELSDAKAKELGLPNPTKEIKLLEADALSAALQIISIASDYNPILVCFDELEGLEVNEAGYFKSQVVGGLVKDLFDAIEQSDVTKGVVILSVIPPAVWRDLLKGASANDAGGLRDRFSSKYLEPIELKYADGESVVNVVDLWLQDFYQSHNLVPPNPVFPFEEEKLRSLGSEKPTIRALLKWCRDNFAISAPPLNKKDIIQKAYDRELAQINEDFLDDSDLIARSLYLGFTTLKGQTIGNIFIQDVTNQVKPLGLNRGSIQFKIIATDNGKEEVIGVGVIQHTHGMTVGSRMQRLTWYDQFKLTRGCVIRSEDRKINKRWEAHTLRAKLVDELGGEYIHLIADHVKPLIAIRTVCDKREVYGVSEDAILAFITDSQIAFNNLLIKDILSNPATVISDDDTETETGIENESDDVKPTFIDITDEVNIDIDSFLE